MTRLLQKMTRLLQAKIALDRDSTSSETFAVISCCSTKKINITNCCSAAHAPMLSRLLPASRTRVLRVQHPTTAARPAPGGQVFILSISGIPRNISFLPFRVTSCNFASLCRSRKGLLHGPSRPFVDKKGVLRGPSWPFVDKKGVLRGPSWPFVDKKKFLVVLCGPSWTKKVFSVVLRGPPWTKKVFLVVLRGPSWTKKVFSVVLRGPSWTKRGVLSGPSRPFVDQKRFSPRPFADRPNYNLANFSSDKRQRALVQHLPSPPDPCNRSSYARTSTHDFPAPLPSRKSPKNPVNPASDNNKLPTLAMPASVV